MSYNPQNPNGQATSANSAPVVLASDQSAVPVSGTVTTTPSGTQTISGTITANAGTNLNTSALALDATLTGGTQKSKLVDSGGTNVATISAGGALKVDGSAVTQPVSDTVTITPSGTQTVAGTVTANAGTNLNTSALALESGGNLATIAGAISASVIQDNIKQVNGVTVNVGTGTASTGTQRVAVASDSSIVLAAGTSVIGQVAASNETNTIYNGATALTPKFATIVASSSGATQVVAAVVAKKIRVLSYTVVANAAVNVKFQSHTIPTDKTGLLYLSANGGASTAYSPVGHFETIAGEALDINLSGAVAVGGHLTYVEV